MSFTSVLEERLNKYASKVKDTIVAAFDLPEIGKLYGTIDAGELRVDVPFTPTAYVEYRKALGDKWRKGAEGWQNSDGDSYFEFIHKATEIPLTLCLDAASKYATCKRVQIGTKEVPIFETICK